MNTQTLKGSAEPQQHNEGIDETLVQQVVDTFNRFNEPDKGKDKHEPDDVYYGIVHRTEVLEFLDDVRYDIPYWVDFIHYSFSMILEKLNHSQLSQMMDIYKFFAKFIQHGEDIDRWTDEQKKLLSFMREYIDSDVYLNQLRNNHRTN